MKHKEDSNAALENTIRSMFSETYTAQNDGETPPALREDSVLLETGLDSLGFAILVTRLEEELGYDPFTLAAEAYYPITFGEFIDFYRINRPT
jgi:acyl carrier protein